MSQALRNCLYPVSRDDVELLRAAQKSFLRVQLKSGLSVPKNQSPKGSKDKDHGLRYLDCAVLRHLHEIIDAIATAEPTFETFDTVRGMFVERGKVYSGIGIYKKSHVQIAVRNPTCIKGLFYPLNSNRDTTKTTNDW